MRKITLAATPLVFLATVSLAGCSSNSIESICSDAEQQVDLAVGAAEARDADALEEATDALADLADRARDADEPEIATALDEASTAETDYQEGLAYVQSGDYEPGGLLAAAGLEPVSLRVLLATTAVGSQCGFGSSPVPTAPLSQ